MVQTQVHLICTCFSKARAFKGRVNRLPHKREEQCETLKEPGRKYIRGSNNRIYNSAPVYLYKKMKQKPENYYKS